MHELDMVFHFDHMHLDYGKYGKFSDKRFRLQDLKRVLSEWQEKMANANGWNSLYWSNHDQPRAVTRFGVDSENYRIKAAKMLGTILHMLQGTPYIFEGEELGMSNAKFTDITDYQDLETKNIYKELTEHHNLDSKTVMRYIYLKSRDNARTPMQWNDSKYAGFSEAKPWIDLNPNYKDINVKQVLNDPDSVFYYYQRLIKLRHTLPIITTGSYELLEPDNSKVYSYVRSAGKHKLLVMGNFTSEKLKINIPTEFKNAEVLIDNYDNKTNFSEIYPWQARVLMI
nr:alpha-amylase family glycosyl hydrolase [Pediococcus claussenii]